MTSRRVIKGVTPAVLTGTGFHKVSAGFQDVMRASIQGFTDLDSVSTRFQKGTSRSVQGFNELYLDPYWVSRGLK